MPTPRCHLCRATLDVDSDDTIVASLYRLVDADFWDHHDEDLLDGDHRLVLACSQAHLAEYLQQYPLSPAVRPDRPDDEEGWVAAVGCTIAALVGLALLVGAGYGFYSLVSAVF